MGVIVESVLDYLRLLMKFLMLTLVVFVCGDV